MLKRRQKLASPLLVLVFMVGALWIAVFYHIPFLLDMVSLKYINPASTAFMRYKTLGDPFKKVEYEWVDYDKISKTLKNAVIIAEDDAFFKHSGLDLQAIKHAAEVNWKRKKMAFGGSTISQQVVKNLYLSPAKDPIRKFREMVLALILDNYLSKERILEIYLNVVEFGPGIYGAEAASHHYFKTSAKNLGPAQAAFLASILPNPNRLGKKGYHLSKRGRTILSRIR